MKNITPIYYLLFFVSGFLLILFICLHFIPNTMVPILIGLLLSYAFDPLIDMFEENGISRKKIVFWFFVAIGSFLLLLITILIPYLFIQLSDFIQNLPELLVKILDFISDKFHMETSTLKKNILNVVQKLYNTENFTKVANLIKLSFSSTANWVFSIISALIIPVFFYFFLIDLDKMKTKGFKLIPKQYQSFIKARLMKVDRILSGFIRGQLMVAIILSVLYSIGLIFLDIKYGLLIGLLSGILNFIPYLGVCIGILFSIILCLLDGSHLIKYAGVLLVFGFVQLLEGFVITPRIVGTKVGLSPFSAILSILIGGELFGVAGMLVAIPIGGVMRVIYRDIKAAYFKSDFYRKKANI